MEWWSGDQYYIYSQVLPQCGSLSIVEYQESTALQFQVRITRTPHWVQQRSYQVSSRSESSLGELGTNCGTKAPPLQHIYVAFRTWKAIRQGRQFTTNSTSRATFSRLVQLRTGHSELNQYLWRFKKVDRAEYERCGYEKETASTSNWSKWDRGSEKGTEKLKRKKQIDARHRPACMPVSQELMNEWMNEWSTDDDNQIGWPVFVSIPEAICI